MLRSGTPTRIQLPWGTNAGGSYIRTVPNASQIGIQDGAASYFDGFPPLSMTPIAGGGKWPFGQDFNGALNQITAWIRWQAAGAPVIYDSSFATGGYTGGYPSGCILQSSGAIGSYWVNLVDNNTTNPDTGGANWGSFYPFNLSATDIGTANAGNINISPSPLSLASISGYPIRVKKISSANTGPYTLNINAGTPSPVLHADGTALASGELPASGWFTVIWDVSNWQLQSTASAVGITPAQLQVQAGNFGFDGGTANALAVTLSPVPLSLASILGSPVRIKKSGLANTGNVTLTLNAFATQAVVNIDGSQVYVEQLPGGCTFEVIWDGTNFILQSVTPRFLGPPFSLYTGGGSFNISVFDCGRTILTTALGAGTGTINLPDAAVVGSGFWFNLRVNSTFSDFGTLDPASTQTIDGLTTRIFGAGTDIVLVCDGANWFTASGIYRRYSSDLTVTASTVLSFTHNLAPVGGATSLKVELFWVCQSTDAGYAAGDVLEGKLSVVNSVAATNTISVSQDSGGNTVRVMTAVNLVAPNKSTTVAANLDYTKWKLRILCETFY